MEIRELRELYESHGQGHVFADWDRLGEADRRSLVADSRLVDFAWLENRLKELNAGAAAPLDLSAIEPAPVVELPRSPEELAERALARRRGEMALSAGKVAAFLVAGGQGTRLGYGGPKGCYAVGPVTGKTLFQWHAERIQAMSARYGRVLPWYIMVSHANEADTRAYFEANDYLGCRPEDVFFLKQALVPSLDADGKLLRAAPGRLALNPDGHGGSLTALVRSGAAADMRRRGIETISYFQVDNPLVAIADPTFLGLHLEAGADFSSKVLAKTGPDEKVGHIVVDREGRLGCVEYSDLPAELAAARAPGGRLRFWAGSIAIHMLSLGFAERVGGGGTLPWHVARKKIPYYDGGKIVKPEKENGVKFETFVFDALPFAQKSVTVETEREEEFAPVKNAVGVDSAESCRRLLTGRFARWLAAAGIEAPRGADGRVEAALEISPRYALDAEELRAKIGAGLRIERALSLS